MSGIVAFLGSSTPGSVLFMTITGSVSFNLVALRGIELFMTITGSTFFTCFLYEIEGSR
jgi:hypothetical protein